MGFYLDNTNTSFINDEYLKNLLYENEKNIVPDEAKEEDNKRENIMAENLIDEFITKVSKGDDSIDICEFLQLDKKYLLSLLFLSHYNRISNSEIKDILMESSADTRSEKIFKKFREKNMFAELDAYIQKNLKVVDRSFEKPDIFNYNSLTYSINSYAYFITRLVDNKNKNNDNKLYNVSEINGLDNLFYYCNFIEFMPLTIDTILADLVINKTNIIKGTFNTKSIFDRVKDRQEYETTEALVKLGQSIKDISSVSKGFIFTDTARKEIDYVYSKKRLSNEIYEENKDILNEKYQNITVDLKELVELFIFIKSKNNDKNNDLENLYIDNDSERIKQIFGYLFNTAIENILADFIEKTFYRLFLDLNENSAIIAQLGIIINEEFTLGDNTNANVKTIRTLLSKKYFKEFVSLLADSIINNNSSNREVSDSGIKFAFKNVNDKLIKFLPDPNNQNNFSENITIFDHIMKSNEYKDFKNYFDKDDSMDNLKKNLFFISSSPDEPIECNQALLNSIYELEMYFNDNSALVDLSKINPESESILKDDSSHNLYENIAKFYIREFINYKQKGDKTIDEYLEIKNFSGYNKIEINNNIIQILDNKASSFNNDCMNILTNKRFELLKPSESSPYIKNYFYRIWKSYYDLYSHLSILTDNDLQNEINRFNNNFSGDNITYIRKDGK